MSQPETPFNDTSIDPFLPAMGQGDFNHEQLSNGYISSEQDHAFSHAGSNIFDLEEFLDSAASSNVSTPDFTGYNFGQKTNDPYFQSAYPPIPGPASPQPYPFQHQQAFYHNAQLVHRPALVRSATNTPSTTYLHPPLQQHSRVQQPYHRRSLSQSDAERISASLNPAFVRHLAPRSRPITQHHHQAKKSKLAPLHQKSSSRSRGVEPNTKGRSKAPTSGGPSIPIETSIGTPFHMTLTGNNDARFRHMSHEKQRNESPRILEIGAMAVINTSRSTPMYSRCTSRSCSDKGMTLGEKVDEMERRIKEEMGECEKGKRGCEMIREALAERKEERKETVGGELM